MLSSLAGFLSEMLPSRALLFEVVLYVPALLPGAGGLMLSGSASATLNAEVVLNLVVLVVGDSLQCAAGCEDALINALGRLWLSLARLWSSEEQLSLSLSLLLSSLSLQSPISPQAHAGLL